MYKLLIICDRPDWAFAKIARAIQVHLSKYEVIVKYGSNSNNLAEHEQFDLILYLLDYRPELLLQHDIPREKVALAIRSHVLEKVIPFYNVPGLLTAKVGAVLAANLGLKAAFENLHPSVFYAPGGTDTVFFTPGDEIVRKVPVAGWAGSRANFGEQHRGLGLIKEACKLSGFDFRPALREDKWRNENEMLRYYQQDIDVYVDMSLTAGRQNGLLEAGACARPLISSHAGIAKELIRNNENGFIIEPDTQSLADALVQAYRHRKELGSAIRSEIEESWDWKVQVTYFAKGFDYLLMLQERE